MLKLMAQVVIEDGSSSAKIPEIIIPILIILVIGFFIALIKIFLGDRKESTETKSEHYQRIIAKYVRIIAGVLMVTAFLGVLAAIVYISVLL